MSEEGEVRAKQMFWLFLGVVKSLGRNTIVFNPGSNIHGIAVSMPIAIYRGLQRRLTSTAT